MDLRQGVVRVEGVQVEEVKVGEGEELDVVDLQDETVNVCMAFHSLSIVMKTVIIV